MLVAWGKGMAHGQADAFSVLGSVRDGEDNAVDVKLTYNRSFSYARGRSFGWPLYCTEFRGMDGLRFIFLAPLENPLPNLRPPPPASAKCHRKKPRTRMSSPEP